MKNIGVVERIRGDAESTYREAETLAEERYNTGQLKERIEAILSIGQYGFILFLKPFILWILTMVITILAFSAFDVLPFVTTIYSIIFFLIAVFNSILAMLVDLPQRLKDDVIGICELSVKIASEIEKDIKESQGSLTKGERLIFFQSILINVVIPIVYEVIKEKIVLIGSLIVYVFDKLISRLTSDIEVDLEEVAIEAEVKDDKVEEGFLMVLDKKLDKVIGIVNRPAKFFFNLSTFISLTILGLLALIILY